MGRNNIMDHSVQRGNKHKRFLAVVEIVLKIRYILQTMKWILRTLLKIQDSEKHENIKVLESHYDHVLCFIYGTSLWNGNLP